MTPASGGDGPGRSTDAEALGGDAGAGGQGVLGGDPVRLLQGGADVTRGLGAEPLALLQELVQAEATPSGAALARVRAGVAAEVGVELGSPMGSVDADPTPAGGAGGLAWGRFAAGAAVIVGLGAAGFWALGQPTAVPEPRVLAPVVVSHPVPDALAIPVPAPAVAAPAELTDPIPEAAASKPAHKAVSDRAVSKLPPPRRSHADPGEELAVLERAQRALRGQPRRALALSRQHARRFGQGQFAPEREMIAIEALLQLDRAADARRRAGEFRRRYPGSSHLPRLDRMLP